MYTNLTWLFSSILMIHLSVAAVRVEPNPILPLCEDIDSGTPPLDRKFFADFTLSYYDSYRQAGDYVGPGRPRLRHGY
ncbi:hypothetical protein FPOAC2_08955 [Fusarium poae]